MSTVDELIATARQNEVIARNLFDIEVAIMNITRCAEFFDSLVKLVQEKFEIEHVWVTLTESPSNSHFIEAASQCETPDLLHRVAMIDFLHATQSIKEPILVNKDLRKLRSLIPANIKQDVASLAILPLIVESKIVGDLVLGTPQQGRYDPKKDSFFLKQLQVKASISLACMKGESLK